MYRVDIAEVVVVVELLGGPWQPRLPTKSEDEIIEPFLTFVKKLTKVKSNFYFLSYKRKQIRATRIKS